MTSIGPAMSGPRRLDRRRPDHAPRRYTPATFHSAFRPRRMASLLRPLACLAAATLAACVLPARAASVDDRRAFVAELADDGPTAVHQCSVKAIRQVSQLTAYQLAADTDDQVRGFLLEKQTRPEAVALMQRVADDWQAHHEPGGGAAIVYDECMARLESTDPLPPALRRRCFDLLVVPSLANVMKTAFNAPEASAQKAAETFRQVYPAASIQAMVHIVYADDAAAKDYTTYRRVLAGCVQQMP